MNWFKMMWLNSKEREILRNASNLVVTTPVPKVEDDDSQYLQTPYKKLYYSNGNLTVIFKDNTVLSKSNVTPEVFSRVRIATTASDIEDILIDRAAHIAPVTHDAKVETADEREMVSNNLGIFKGNDVYEVKGNQVYLKGVNLPMPAPVAASFIELEEKAYAARRSSVAPVAESAEIFEQIEALKMFWLKLALNTIPQSREDLLNFIRRNDVKITRNGNLILYRRIVTKEGADTQLVTYVTQEYYRLKKSNQDPREFAIAKDDDTYITVDLTSFDPQTSNLKPFCNLQQMYLELPTYDTNTFTSAHDRSVEIKLGGIYKIPDKKINLNNGLCAAGGLHAACVNYNYSGFGDMPVVVLVSPSKAITVPTGDPGKLRTTEMFVACVNDKPMGVHFDEGALSAFDTEYNNATLTELEEAAKSKSFEKLSIQDTVPAISLVDLNTIKDMLKSRIKAI